MSRFAGVLFVGLVLMACGHGWRRLPKPFRSKSDANSAACVYSDPTSTSSGRHYGVGYLLGWPRGSHDGDRGCVPVRGERPGPPTPGLSQRQYGPSPIDNKAVAYTAVVGSRV